MYYLTPSIHYLITAVANGRIKQHEINENAVKWLPLITNLKTTSEAVNWNVAVNSLSGYACLKTYIDAKALGLQCSDNDHVKDTFSSFVDQLSKIARFTPDQVKAKVIQLSKDIQLENLGLSELAERIVAS